MIFAIYFLFLMGVCSSGTFILAKSLLRSTTILKLHTYFLSYFIFYAVTIEHVAIYVKDLERIKSFYLNYFDCSANQMYFNPKTGFSSFFISFSAGARIELMNKSEITGGSNIHLGLHHFAVSLKNEEEVNILTEKMAVEGINVVSGPRTTGDGYYESVIEDPEGNLIELTCPKKN